MSHTRVPALPDRAPRPPVSFDAAVVRRARAGDPAAFRKLFELHVAPVGRFAADLLRDATAGREATQETFVRAHRGLAALADDARVLPWLLGIARNVCFEQLRERRRAARFDDIDDPALEQTCDAPGPEALLLGREADAMLADSLGQLDEERRAALLLRTDHGLAYEEIAELLGWPLHKVKNEIRRARLVLRAALAGYLRGEP